jgi:hypothetical protein
MPAFSITAAPFGDVGFHARLHFLRTGAAHLHAVEHGFLFDFGKIQDVVYVLGPVYLAPFTWRRVFDPQAV